MVEPGDIVIRIYGDGYIRTQMRVSAVDDKFIYCNAQRSEGSAEWFELSPTDEPWKFDTTYGVETDEEMGWGVGPGSRRVVLTYLDLPDLPYRVVTIDGVHRFIRR